MINLRSSGLRGSNSKREDFNPGEGLLNLADVMLVFACGLLVALISSWNVNLPGSTQVEAAGEMQQIEGQAQESADPAAVESGYTELGKVYEDPATGKLYMVVGDAAAAPSE